MGYFREFLVNAKRTYQFKPGYYWLTTSVGLVALAVACWFMLVVHALLTPLANTVFAIPLFLLSLPFVFYATGVCVAGTFGAVMVCLQRFTPSDAVQYALLSRYPKHWFKQ
jgi:hypothetical protein